MSPNPTTLHTFFLYVTAPNGAWLTIRRLAYTEQAARDTVASKGYTIHSITEVA